MIPKCAKSNHKVQNQVMKAQNRLPEINMRRPEVQNILRKAENESYKSKFNPHRQKLEIQGTLIQLPEAQKSTLPGIKSSLPA